VIRVPLMQGFPLRTAGFTETRSCHDMARLYPFRACDGCATGQIPATVSFARASVILCADSHVPRLVLLPGPPTLFRAGRHRF
jgi:hypothetical protein